MRNTAIIIAVLILTGCTIMRMQKEIKDTEDRISQKEAQLSELETQSARLEEHQTLLVEMLDKTRLTSRQLNDELDQLIQQNRQLAVMAQKQGRDIEQIKQEVKTLEAQQASLAKVAASGDSETIKAEKIQALQNEIRNYLLLGLKAKHRKNL